MVSAVNTISFANKKPSLLGSLVMSQDLDQGQQADNATTDAGNPSQNSHRNNGSLDNAVATFSNITTPDDSVLVIIFATSTFIQNVSSTKDWRIEEDTGTVDSFTRNAASGTVIQAQLRVYIDETPTPGTHTYEVLEDDANGFGGTIANLFFIKGTDTHATKNINILGG